MSEADHPDGGSKESTSFYERPNVKEETIPIRDGIPFGLESVFNPELGIGGAYGTWGRSIDNAELPRFVEERAGTKLPAEEVMNLGELGFVNRQHVPDLSQEEHLELEVEVGSRLIQEAARSNGWKPAEVEGLLVGTSGPVSSDYVTRIAQRAGIPESALKVSVHKACDGSVGGLNLALNPGLDTQGKINIAEELRGKKVLVGGIEGLSRFIAPSRDLNALQLFGNGAGMIGVIPGTTMKYLVGGSYETYDEDGLLAVRMNYPHSHKRIPGQSLVEFIQEGISHIHVSGLMHEPADGSPIAMAGLMGMVKLFVRSGVQAVTDVFRNYQRLLEKLGMPEKQLAVAIVHHANY